MTGGWERLAAHTGGTIVALATASMGPPNETALFAAAATGLFRSDDAGVTWSATSDTPLPLLTTVASSSRFATNHRLYAGTETGFFRSVDGGCTWRQTLAGGRVFTVAVVPSANGDEHVFVGTEADGILRSENGGETWTGANAGLLDLTVLALAFSPNVVRDQTGFAATASGLYRTRNGGKSWREVALPLDEAVVQCLAISPNFATDRLVLAGTEADGLLRSGDGGATWERARDLSDGGVSAIAFSSHDADSRVIAAAMADGVALSRDDGETWSLSHASPPVLSLAFVTDETTEVLVAGLYRDGAARLLVHQDTASWHPATAGLHGTVRTTLVACSDRTLVVAGPEAGIRISRDGGQRWETSEIGFEGPTVHGLAATAGVDGRCHIFAATDAGIARSHDGGRHWHWPTTDDGARASLVAPGTDTRAGVITVFAATLDGRLMVSDDAGMRWRKLDTPFAGEHIIALACPPEFAHDRTVYVGAARPPRLADGSRAVTLWRSPNGGVTWTRWLHAEGDRGTLPLAVPPDNRDLVFVGLAAGVVQPRPNAWETRGGVRAPLWRTARLTTESGAVPAITALAVSPHFGSDGTVLAATSAGVYRSSDRGRTFTPWHDGLGPVPILALATARTTEAPNDERCIVFALGVDGTIWRRPG